MVSLTRQDCSLASAGLMRSGLAHALHHTRHRSVFQKHLADQPLMRSVLADMAVHVEASTALVMRLCRSFDRAPHDKAEAAYMRLLTPVVKYWTCKSAPGFLYEAMECLGGNGYVEEGILARHYRESPVNAIWKARAMSCASTCCVRCRAKLTLRPTCCVVLSSRPGIARRRRSRWLHRKIVSSA
jgi:putative acyl-CoA dehydrogenase